MVADPRVCLRELLDICLVPSLNQDIEDNPIDRANFHEFHRILGVNSDRLFNLLSNEDLLTGDDPGIAQLREKVVMLMCEHAPVTSITVPPYSLEDPSYWKKLREVVSREIVTPETLSGCLNQYKEQLLNSRWRTNIGITFGFTHFCENHWKQTGSHSDSQTILFILSIAGQFCDCIHGEIKVLGFRMYHNILTICPQKVLLEFNIHKVIIKDCLENCQKLLDDQSLFLLWTDVTLALCLDTGIQKDLSWNELDKSLHLLFQKIKVEGKRENRRKLRSLLVQIIRKCYGTDAERLVCHSDYLAIQQEMCRKKQRNVKLLRWIPDLKELFIFECLSVSNCTESTEEVLQFIAESYLLTMSGLDSDVVKAQLDDMVKRLTPLLLEIFRLNRSNQRVIMIITHILHMFLEHFNQLSRERSDSSKSNHHLALNKLLTEHLPHPLSLSL